MGKYLCRKEFSLEESFYKDLLDNFYDGVYFVDAERTITYWNHGAERITGYSSQEVVGKRCMDNILVHVNQAGLSLCQGNCPLKCSIIDAQPRETEAFLKHKQGHRVPIMIRTTPLQDSKGEIIGGVEVFSDNSRMFSTQSRITQLEEEVNNDGLTGLYNRKLLDLKLESLIHEANYLSPAAVLFLDIDRFKKVNDKYGHDAGDRVLQTISQTFKQNIRDKDIVGRWGGEEFMIILVDLKPGYLLEIANKIRILTQSTSILWNTEEIHITVSIGGTMINTTDSVATIIQRVDQLLYKSKEDGRNRVTIS